MCHSNTEVLPLPVTVAKRPSPIKKCMAGLMYAISSFAIIAVNKVILTTYSFPSPYVLGLGQMAASLLILTVGHYVGVCKIKPLTRHTFISLQPLPMLYLCNMLTGLVSTKNLPLPMFTVIRRFSLIMAMLGEYLILGTRVSRLVVFSVLLMVLGAVVAAYDDFTFDARSYSIVMLNNLFTAANAITGKYKLINKNFDTFNLLYYNCLFMILPLLVIILGKQELMHLYGRYELMHNHTFVLLFSTSCVLGFLLNYSHIMSTKLNTVLTTSVIGSMKNISITYIGMLVGGDYVYSSINFIGVSISVTAAVLYSLHNII